MIQDKIILIELTGLRKMNHAYNLRDSYSVAQAGTNLTDYGNAVGSSYDATETTGMLLLPMLVKHL